MQDKYTKEQLYDLWQNSEEELHYMDIRRIFDWIVAFFIGGITTWVLVYKLHWL